MPSPGRPPPGETSRSRAERIAAYEAAFRRAASAGAEAAASAPRHRIRFSDGSEQDAIGFAVVRVSPGNRGFGRWLTHTRRGASGYPRRGVVVYPDTDSPALAPQAAWCVAFAQVVETEIGDLEQGLLVYVDERLD